MADSLITRHINDINNLPWDGTPGWLDGWMALLDPHFLPSQLQDFASKLRLPPTANIPPNCTKDTALQNYFITSCSSFLWSNSHSSGGGADALAKVPLGILSFSRKQTKVWFVSAKIKRAGETNHRIGWSEIWINFFRPKKCRSQNISST